MKVTVVTVHPTVVMLRGEQKQFELPKSAFPVEPIVGQDWVLHLSHEPTEDEKIADLNALLPRA